MTTLATESCLTRLAAGTPLLTQFDAGRIEVYSGDIPAGPELPPTGLLLARVVATSAPTPPRYELVGPDTQLDSTKSWVLQIIAVGEPGYVRIVGNGSYPASVIYTDQHSLPTITSLSAAIAVTSFYLTLST